MKEKIVKNLDKIFITLTVINLIAVILGGVFLIKDNATVKKYEKTFGYVSKAEKTDDGKKQYILMYFADSQRFEVEYDYADSETYIGEQVAVYYDKENPEKIFVESSKVSYALLFAGIILAVIETALYLPMKKKTVLLNNGVRINCAVKGIKKAPFSRRKLLCDSSDVLKRKGKPFVSKSLSREYAKTFNGKTVSVYYHAKKPNIYFVKTDK